MLGGACRGNLYVARQDGVGPFVHSDVVSAQLVASSAAMASTFAIAHDVVYIGFVDGHAQAALGAWAHVVVGEDAVRLTFVTA